MPQPRSLCDHTSDDTRYHSCCEIEFPFLLPTGRTYPYKDARRLILSSDITWYFRSKQLLILDSSGDVLHTLRLFRKIGKGSSGDVYAYTDAHLGVAVKIQRIRSPTADPAELAVTTHTCFQRGTIVLPLRYIGRKTTKHGYYAHIFVMPLMDGDLFDLILDGRLSDADRCTFSLAVIKSVGLQVEHLARHGFWYMDIKAENILYHVLEQRSDTTNTTRILVQLGDLGSTMPHKGRVCCTFPPFGPHTVMGMIDIHWLTAGTNQQATIRWGLGMVLAQCLPTFEEHNACLTTMKIRGSHREEARQVLQRRLQSVFGQQYASYLTI